MKTLSDRKSFIVVAYDISEDRRRSRLHKRLKKFGLAVQYSVFECLLTPDQFKDMKAMVRPYIKPNLGDRIRYYHLCESCRKRIQATDGVTEQDRPVLFA
ncbi:CRISPR-associated endonuclease Cas2 [candidate division KSB1 bacterium]|nr:CRISPR-associated endonuclease Cas2 [bacterium]NUM68401.1 CRISPR-associated endonuclease Cas2 [candidate division KSB1 bacterium]